MSSTTPQKTRDPLTQQKLELSQYEEFDVGDIVYLCYFKGSAAKTHRVYRHDPRTTNFRTFQKNNGPDSIDAEIGTVVEKCKTDNLFRFVYTVLMMRTNVVHTECIPWPIGGMNFG